MFEYVLTTILALTIQVCAAGPLCQPGKFPDPFRGNDYFLCPTNLSACTGENAYARPYCYKCCNSSVTTPAARKDMSTIWRDQKKVAIKGLRKRRAIRVLRRKRGKQLREKKAIIGLRKDRFLVVVGVAVVGGVALLTIVFSFVKRHRMAWNTPACGAYYLQLEESPPVVCIQPQPTTV